MINSSEKLKNISLSTLWMYFEELTKDIGAFTDCAIDALGSEIKKETEQKIEEKSNAMRFNDFVKAKAGLK